MKASISQALARLPSAPTSTYPDGAPFVRMMADGSMSVEHRFENFSQDFVTWVVFYGPQGGEQP